jgi:hypothetical protein
VASLPALLHLLFAVEVKVKVKVIPVLLFLTEHHAMKTYWGVDV